MRVRLKLERLVYLLAESSLSQNHWAMKLGLSRGHWSDIVNGKHPFPSARTRERMLDAFGVPLEELFQIEAGAQVWSQTDFRMAIGGQYLVDQELRQGGMGAVYLARDHHLRTVAIKVVAPEAVSGIGVTQFLKEIATIANLQHPHILPLYDSGEAAGHPYYVMPYIRGGSLRERLQQQTRLDLDQVVRIVDGVATALHHAHQHHVLHCDVKPENVLLDEGHPYVMDFGIARAIHSEAYEWGKTGTYDLSAGTPAYVSPEQANGERDLDGRSDTYSLGCMVFEMLAGRPPFEGTTTQAVVARRFLGLIPDLRDFAPEVPRGVARVIEQAMELERDRRPSSSVGFAAALRQAAAGRSRVLSATSLVTTRAVARARRRLGFSAASAPARLVGDLWNDLVLTGRSIRRSPGFALTVILTLGLALGANATMFGIVDRLLLRPPDHIVQPEQVHRLQVARWFGGLSGAAPAVSYPAFRDVRDRSRLFSQVAAVEFANLSHGSGREASLVRAVLVSGQYFPLLGVRPAIGRFFGEEEDRPPSGIRVAVVSHPFWRSRLGADPAVLGRTIQLNNRPYEIIGVTPPGFTGTELTPADLWIPMMAAAADIADFDEGWTESRGSQFLQVFVRVREGVDFPTANEDVRRAYHEGHADWNDYESKAVASLAPLNAARNRNLRGGEGVVSSWLLGVTVIVLLIACANTANLVLARGVSRRGEIAIRLALGVSRERLFRQLLVESLALASLAGIVALLVVQVGARVLRTSVLPDLEWIENPVDSRVLGVTAGATFLVAILAGFFPLLSTTRIDLSASLHGSARATIGHSRRLRSALLLAQTSLCTILLIGAGLFLRSMERARGLDLGFLPERLLRIDIDLSHTAQSDRERALLYRQAVERLAAVPQLESASISIGGPFMTTYGSDLRIPGRDSLPRLPGGGPYYYRVGGEFLETIGAQVLRGRSIRHEDDRPGAAPVAVLTERMARAIWPGEDPLGKCLIVDDGPCSAVVGIIKDIHRQNLEESPFLLYFIPLIQGGEDQVPQFITVRAAGPVEAAIEPIRRVLQELRADLPYIEIQPYEERIGRQTRSWRMGSTMFVLFGGLSLVIAAIGLYGVLSYSVSQRTHELGIRAAVGATPGRLRRMVLGSGLLAASLGIVLGMVTAYLLSSRVQAMLFQTSARDPYVFLGVAGLVLIIAAAASLIPGIRATRIDPLRALRAE
jgi:predicted permease